MMNGLSLYTHIVSGENITQQFEFGKYKKVLLVTDKIMVKIGLADIIKDRLTQMNVSYSIFDEVEPNPSFATVNKGVQLLVKSPIDAIIALGGGSVIDAAKGFIYYFDAVQKEMGLKHCIPELIAIPTTSGAGSEVTAYAVITDTENQIKIPLVSDLIYPKYAIIDPIFTRSCPAKVTAESGIDVLTHILESYVSTNTNTYTEALCEKVLKLVFGNLKQVYVNGDDLQARLAMHEASCMAGIAFTNSGLGLNHALSHSLGGRFHIPHGRANALCMPHVIRLNQQKSAEKYAQLAKLLDLPAKNTDEGCLSLLVGIEYLCASINLERSVLEFGIDKQEYLNAIPEMAQAAYKDPCLTTNPVQASIEDIENIYKRLV